MTQAIRFDRRTWIISGGAFLAASAVASPASAQGLNLSSILGRATDGALDKLAQPGAFYNDEDIRIGLPIVGNLGGGGGLLGSLVRGADRLGLLNGVTRKINDAAGIAAGEAKPIFRDAIDDLSWTDAPGIIREGDGGTQYLRRSSNDTLHSKLEPLVDSALEKLGVYGEIDSLAEKHSFVRRAGLDRDGINRSVTDQGLDGIFSYIGNEERSFRKNPLGGLGNILGL